MSGQSSAPIGVMTSGHALDMPCDDGVNPGVDATPYLTIVVIALYGISANQVLAPLGEVGRPALLLAGGAGLLWLTARLLPQAGMPRGGQPLRIAVFVFVWYEGATIVAAHTRSLTLLEQSGSARAGITILCLAGLALLVMDGIRSIEQLNVFLRRLTLAVGFMAVIGILQFIFGRSFEVNVPGLVFNQDPATIQMRSIFNRPKGTALHPIEFGVVLGAMVPLALHFALEWKGPQRKRQLSVVVAVVVALAAPLSISRSAIVALIASLAVMWLAWRWRRRMEAAIVALLALPILWLGIPGLLGTFRSLFSSFGQDPSIQARIDRIPRVMALIKESPWFGRGSGTLSMEDYLLLDNQVWATILSSGIVGLLVLLGLIVLAVIMAISSQHHRFATRETRHLGYAIAAGIVGFTVSFTTFDALFFKILQATLFILVGAAGALWRLTGEPSGRAVGSVTLGSTLDNQTREEVRKLGDSRDSGPIDQGLKSRSWASQSPHETI